jgi:anti-sigma factor RsiW
MNCPIGRQPELLLEYSAGRLATAEAAELERHLATCPECRSVAAAQSAAWNALDAAEAPPVSPDFDRRLWARIQAEEGRGWRARVSAFLFWRPAMAAALACVLIVAAVFVQRPRPATDRVHADSIDAERIERALDDLEMLRQFALASSEPKAM